MKLTTQEARQIGAAIETAYAKNPSTANVGRAAYEAVFPIAAAEALAELTQNEVNTLVRYLDREGGMPEGWALIINEHIFANRLAHLTANPDPAVEAATEVLKEFASDWKHVPEYAAKVVAAVDHARAGQRGSK